MNACIAEGNCRGSKNERTTYNIAVVVAVVDRVDGGKRVSTATVQAAVVTAIGRQDHRGQTRHAPLLQESSIRRTITVIGWVLLLLLLPALDLVLYELMGIAEGLPFSVLDDCVHPMLGGWWTYGCVTLLLVRHRVEVEEGGGRTRIQLFNSQPQ